MTKPPLSDLDRHLLAEVSRHVEKLLPRLEALLNAPGPDACPLPGKHFSDLEQRIWDALAAGPLRGAEVAQAAGEPLNGRLTGILANLVDRDVLVRGPRGYARAPRFPAASRWAE